MCVFCKYKQHLTSLCIQLEVDLSNSLILLLLKQPVISIFRPKKNRDKNTGTGCNYCCCGKEKHPACTFTSPKSEGMHTHARTKATCALRLISHGFSSSFPAFLRIPPGSCSHIQLPHTGPRLWLIHSVSLVFFLLWIYGQIYLVCYLTPFLQEKKSFWLKSPTK